MAPQKRKHPHDAGTDRSVPDAPARRSTRQHPDASAEPEHQSRSGRARASTIEKPSGGEVARPASRGRKADAPKQKAAAPTDPAVATTVSTRATRHEKATAGPELGVGAGVSAGAGDGTGVEATPVSPVSKKNVRPPTPPDKGERRVAEAQAHAQAHAQAQPKQSKQSRYRSRSRSRSPPQPKLRRPSSTSQSRTFVPRPSQRPARSMPGPASAGRASAASAVASTPKRTPSNKANIVKPPGTPRSDRNIDKIVFGNTSFKAWYPSYYGKEVLGDVSANVGGGNAKMGGGKRDPPMLDRLYICPCCFKYSREAVPWWKHVRYCEKKAFVPGTKIYTHPRRSKAVRMPPPSSTSASPTATAGGKRKSKSDDSDQSAEATVREGEWSVWEVDGEKDGLFCQNLSLFAKLFLDNKSVFFDVTGFNYFLLVYTPPLPETHPTSAEPGSAPEPLANPQNSAPVSSNPPVDEACTSPSTHPRPQIVGFFSKEQMSWDNNNLACILVFPPWQRKGLGTLLMGVSYEISRREGILGGPEKPISELGRKGYKRFWAGEITRWILELDESTPSTESAHATKHTRREREKEKEKDRRKDKVKEQEGLIVDVERCSRDTWIVPEDCLAVLREMGVVEEAGLGPPRDERDSGGNGSADANTHGKEKEEKESKLPLVPRVRIDKAAVRNWARENRIDLTRACDPDGFVEGYAIKQVKDNNEDD
ncbi:acyl-CoA N-acyltransferase [Ustulina deusta]|nr:acyl-CoA N-acyltransferase [Ustulina deusta]